MISVPSYPEAAIGWSTPIKGDPEEPRAVSNYLQQIEWNADGYRRNVGLSAMRLAQLRSEGVTALQTKLNDRLVPGSTMIEQSVQRAKSGFDSYASSIESIHGRARRQRDRVRRALETISVQANEISRIVSAIGLWSSYSWESRIPLEMPAPSLGGSGLTASEQQEASDLRYRYAWSWRNAARRWHEALDAIDAARIAWRTLISERAAVERDLLGTLRETALGQLLQMAGTGSIEPKDMIVFGIAGEQRGRSYADPGAQHREVEALLARALSPEQLVEAWEALGLTEEQIAALPIETLARLADRDALPAWVQDIASTSLLHYAAVEPRKAYELMGFGPMDMRLDEFRGQLMSLHLAWQEAGHEVATLSGDRIVQLIGLGNHDGALTAAISHGDLDTASRVGVNVSGMLSDVGSIGHDANGARSILREALLDDRHATYAMVTWIGYRSPHPGNVNGMGRAEAGGRELASFIVGINTNRRTYEQPVASLGVFAHSYGSTTAAEALKLIDESNEVDAFVTYGSAGLKNGTSVDEIHAARIFAVHGPGDNVAFWGKRIEHALDPRHLPGTVVFSGDGGDDFLEVTSHDMYTEDDSPSFFNRHGKTGYTTPRTRSVRSMGRILATGGLEKE